MKKVYMASFAILLYVFLFQLVANAAFIYSDVDAGVTFKVSSHWSEEKFETEANWIDTKFVSNERNAMIVYGSTDVWAQISEYEKNGDRREDFNNNMFTKADLAETYNIEEKDVELVAYNEYEYFEFTLLGVKTLIRMDNGWMYMFQFGGELQGEAYKDFEFLLDSVNYPNTSHIPQQSNNYDKDNSDSNLIWLTACILIGCTILMVIYKDRIKKKRLKMNAVSIAKEVGEFDEKLYCGQCKTVLLYNSEFCHNCGKRITKGDI